MQKRLTEKRYGAQVESNQAALPLITTAADLSLAKVPEVATPSALEVTGIGCIYPGPKQGQSNPCMMGVLLDGPSFLRSQ